MSLRHFRTYHLALEFYAACEKVKCAYRLKDQLTRASSSIPLNLAEGSAKPTASDRGRFYFYALGSLRECEAVLDILHIHPESGIKRLCSKLGAHIFQLCKAENAIPPSTRRLFNKPSPGSRITKTPDGGPTTGDECRSTETPNDNERGGKA